MTSPIRISPKETVAMAVRAVWAHKFRSGLTILGIVIGITTVVTVASLLAGLRKGIVDFFQEFGPDNIFVARVSGDPSGQNARPKGTEAHAHSPGVCRLSEIGGAAGGGCRDQPVHPTASGKRADCEGAGIRIG